MIKTLFVNLLHQFYDLHGIYSLASVMKQNHIGVDYIGTKNYGKAISYVKKNRPDIVLYSACSSMMPTYVRFDRCLKQAVKIKSLIGGPGPTFDYEFLKTSTIDILCAGEGETAIVDFLQNDFKSNKNVFSRGEKFPSEFFPLVDLNLLPFPDRSIVYDKDSLLRNLPSKQFFSGRGCPYDCAYCFNHQFRQLFGECGPVVRQKSVDYLFAEIEDVRKRYPLKDVIFNDDTFILNKKWFWEFSRRFPKEIGMTYTCNIRANLLDEEIAKALEESRCRGVNWSVETGDAYLRNKVLRRGISDDQIFKTADLLKKYRIPFRTGNMLGLPGETLPAMDKTIDINIRIKPRIAFVNIFVPFPGLELTKYGIEKGLCLPTTTSSLPRNYFTRTVMNYTPEEKTAIHKKLFLFPVFVQFPALFYNRTLYKMLFALPEFFLRILYEFMYTTKLAAFYSSYIPFRLKCRMAKRYLENA